MYPVLKKFSIIKENLGYFILNNTPNNDTTLIKLIKKINFKPIEKRLRYIGHIMNLIAEVYLFR